MAKRFHSTEIWVEDWFIKLSSEEKFLWFFILDDCDHAGIWKPNKIIFEASIKGQVDLEGCLNKFNADKTRVEVLPSGRWFIIDFIVFQYGKQLNPNNRMHKSIIQALTYHEVNLTSIRPQLEVIDSSSQGIDTPKEQEQEQEKVIEQEDNKGKKIKTSMPDGFGISDRVRSWANKNGHQELESHLDSFKRKVEAHGYKYINWDSAFMEAIRENWGKIGATGIGFKKNDKLSGIKSWAAKNRRSWKVEKTDFSRFALLMATLAETFGNTTPSEQKIEIYYRALSDLTIDHIDHAVIELLNTRTITSTFPVPAEIRNAIGGRVDDTALLALDKAEKAVEKHGSYHAVVFDDPVIHMVIRSMGGWPKFCCPSAYGDDQEWQWKQKEFVALYKTFSRSPRAECPPVLIGLGNTSYEADGKIVLISPKYVGDQQKAMAWSVEKQSLPESRSNKISGFIESVLVNKSAAANYRE